MSDQSAEFIQAANNLAHSKKDLLNNLILKFHDTNYLGLAEKIGMYIPPNQPNPIDYFLTNFVEYQEVIDRPANIMIQNVDLTPESSDINYRTSFYSTIRLMPVDPREPDSIMEHLSKLSDLEIFHYLGLFIHYTSRNDLITKIVKMIDSPTFFVSFFHKNEDIYSPNDQRFQSPINIETTLLTPIDEIGFKIGYGTINNFRIYEIDELDHAFRFISFDEPSEIIQSDTRESHADNLVDQIIPLFDWQEPGNRSSSESVNKSEEQNQLILPIFSRPEDPEDDFSQDELIELYSILNDCISGPINGIGPSLTSQDRQSINDILSKIIIGNEIKREFEVMDDQKIDQLRKLPSSEKKLVKTWFLSLFEIGMYMRRWKGPGYPYPILEPETLSNDSGNNVSEEEPLPGSSDSIHEQKTLRSIMALKELEANLSSESIHLLESLIGYNLIRGKIYKDRFNLSSRIETVLTKGYQTTDACIRLSSTIFIGTAYIYLYKIFNHVISEFNPNLIEQVT